VARSEILSPEFERELRRAQAADTLFAFAKDKYRMAYQDYLATPSAASLPSPLSSGLTNRIYSGRFRSRLGCFSGFRPQYPKPFPRFRRIALKSPAIAPIT
jgi:hypothetical protein